MDTPGQRVVLAWIINLIGWLALTAVWRVFRLPRWTILLAMALLGALLALAGLRLAPVW